MDKSRIHILVVEDELGLCAGIQEALQREADEQERALAADPIMKRFAESRRSQAADPYRPVYHSSVPRAG